MNMLLLFANVIGEVRDMDVVLALKRYWNRLSVAGVYLPFTEALFNGGVSFSVYFPV